MKWKKMSSPAHFNTVTVPYSNPPVIIGGNDKTYSTTSDVSLYDASKDSWIKVGSLTSPRKKNGSVNDKQQCHNCCRRVHCRWDY